jgi:hypothetical protein
MRTRRAPAAVLAPEVSGQYRIGIRRVSRPAQLDRSDVLSRGVGRPGSAGPGRDRRRGGRGAEPRAAVAWIHAGRRGPMTAEPSAWAPGRARCRSSGSPPCRARRADAPAAGAAGDDGRVLLPARDDCRPWWGLRRSCSDRGMQHKGTLPMPVRAFHLSGVRPRALILTSGSNRTGLLPCSEMREHDSNWADSRERGQRLAPHFEPATTFPVAISKPAHQQPLLRRSGSRDRDPDRSEATGIRRAYGSDM